MSEQERHRGSEGWRVGGGEEEQEAAQWAKTEKKTGRLSPSLQGEDSGSGGSNGRVCREKDTQSARRREEERVMVGTVLVRGEEFCVTLVLIRVLSLIGQQVSRVLIAKVRDSVVPGLILVAQLFFSFFTQCKKTSMSG